MAALKVVPFLLAVFLLKAEARWVFGKCPEVTTKTDFDPAPVSSNSETTHAYSIFIILCHIFQSANI